MMDTKQYLLNGQRFNSRSRQNRQQPRRYSVGTDTKLMRTESGQWRMDDDILDEACRIAGWPVERHETTHYYTERDHRVLQTVTSVRYGAFESVLVVGAAQPPPWFLHALLGALIDEAVRRRVHFRLFAYPGGTGAKADGFRSSLSDPKAWCDKAIRALVEALREGEA